MHGLTITTVALALLAAEGAQAQTAPGAPYPVPGRPVATSATTTTTVAAPAPPPAAAAAPRWGTKIGGRWWAGANAPGGWNAYRRPGRGWALPPYWTAPRFRVTDWDRYGLARPAPGRNWVRYYDDAVLIDARGSIYDSAGDVDWDRFDRGYAPAPTYGARTYEGRGDTGLGGAAIGAVAGGVAGNLIAGRGNRLGGTLIGAGVGAAAGYAIDRAEDRREPPHRRRHDRDYDGYADGYDYPVAPPYAPPPPPPPPPPSRWVSPDGATVVTTTVGGPAGGYGYGYPGGSTTTVTVQTAPVVTTTTTEYYDAPVTVRHRPVIRSRRGRTKLIRAK